MKSNLPQQEEDARQVEHIPSEPKYVHVHLCWGVASSSSAMHTVTGYKINTACLKDAGYTSAKKGLSWKIKAVEWLIESVCVAATILCWDWVCQSALTLLSKQAR